MSDEIDSLINAISWHGVDFAHRRLSVKTIKKAKKDLKWYLNSLKEIEKNKEKQIENNKGQILRTCGGRTSWKNY